MHVCAVARAAPIVGLSNWPGFGRHVVAVDEEQVMPIEELQLEQRAVQKPGS